MEYTVESIDQVKKKVSVTVPVEEVNAALSATIAMYRTSVNISGFRKGKTPASVIEGRFRKEVYAEATQDLVNVHINQIVGEMTEQPASRIDFEGGELVRDEAFAYSLSFEVMPTFDLPDYDGMEVEQEKVEIADSDVDAVVERIRASLAEYEDIKEHRTAQDGEQVTFDFAAYKDGVALKEIAAENFQLNLGESQALPEFEEIVRRAKPGEEVEGEVTFPADFLNADLAGKTVTMKITVHAIKTRKLPAADDDMAKKVGGFESFAKMRETIVSSYQESGVRQSKAKAQHEMVSKLLKMVEFPVPESMREMYIDNIIADLREQQERQGKSLVELGKTAQELRDSVREEAIEVARIQIFLLAAARKEGLDVSEEEVDNHLRQIAARNRQEFDALKENYVRNNLIFALRDRILADKAMDAIYEKAKVVEVPAKKAEAKAE